MWQTNLPSSSQNALWDEISLIISPWQPLALRLEDSEALYVNTHTMICLSAEDLY